MKEDVSNFSNAWFSAQGEVSTYSKKQSGIRRSLEVGSEEAEGIF